MHKTFTFDDLLYIRSGDHELFFSGGGYSEIITLSDFEQRDAAYKFLDKYL